MPTKEQTTIPCATSPEAAVYDAVPLPSESSNKIRLLKICDKSEGQPISCVLHVASLDDEYVALSYMWDDGPTTKSIALNGKPFHVQQNLWDFLYQRRQDEEADGDAKYLWIDALCINQTSNPEKSHQVAIMGDIYLNALWVQIWLGPDKESLSQAMALLQNIDQNIHEHPSSDIAYKDLLELCNHAYWSRAWILQECVLADTLKLQCGPKQVSVAAIATLYRSRFLHPELINAADEGLHSCFASSAAIQVLEARQKYNPSKRSYYHPWIDHKRFVKCVRPRDRIYAMISLMDPAEPRIVPDYDKSAEQVFVDLVDNHVECGPQRVNHVASIAMLLDLVPLEKETKQWPLVVLVKMAEAIHDQERGDL